MLWVLVCGFIRSLMYSGAEPFFASYTISRMAYSMLTLTGSQCNDFNIGVMLSLYGVLEMPDFVLFVTLTKVCQICQRKVHKSSPVYLLPVTVPTFLEL